MDAFLSFFSNIDWLEIWLATGDTLMMLGGSLLFHALLLSLHFSFPDASRAFQDRALDIVLVNSKSAHRPSDAQALAQEREQLEWQIRLIYFYWQDFLVVSE